MGINGLTLSHAFLKSRISSGGFCIDATAGRGRDTLFLSEIVGPYGHIVALDIQQQAVDATKALLEQKEIPTTCAQVFLDSHVNIDRYAAAGSVDGIVFNFGWLPGGDHRIFTRKESSLIGVQKGLELLKNGGIMSLCLYYGRENGYEERDALLAFLQQLDDRQYTVIVNHFCNRKNDPPIPVMIIKEG